MKSRISIASISLIFLNEIYSLREPQMLQLCLSGENSDSNAHSIFNIKVHKQMLTHKGHQLVRGLLCEQGVHRGSVIIASEHAIVA